MIYCGSRSENIQIFWLASKLSDKLSQISVYFWSFSWTCVCVCVQPLQYPLSSILILFVEGYHLPSASLLAVFMLRAWIKINYCPFCSFFPTMMSRLSSVTCWKLLFILEMWRFLSHTWSVWSLPFYIYPVKCADSPPLSPAVSCGSVFCTVDVHICFSLFPASALFPPRGQIVVLTVQQWSTCPSKHNAVEKPCQFSRMLHWGKSCCCCQLLRCTFFLFSFAVNSNHIMHTL